MFHDYSKLHVEIFHGPKYFCLVSNGFVVVVFLFFFFFSARSEALEASLDYTEKEEAF